MNADNNCRTSTQTQQAQHLQPITPAQQAELLQRGLTVGQVRTITKWRFARIVADARARKARKAVAK